MIRYSVLLAVVIIVLLGTQNTVQANESLEYKLACINSGDYVSRDHISVNRIRSLLNQLSATYVENKQEIGDMSAYVQKQLKENGVEEGLLNIMEDLNQFSASKVGNQKYTNYSAAYLILRIQGQSRAQTIRGLRGYLRKQGVY